MIVINVLFIGGAKRLSFAERLIETGISLNVKINIFSYELTKDVPISKIASVIIGKKWEDNLIVEDLTQVINLNNINIILPFVDPAIELLSLNRHLWPDVFIPVSNATICSSMFDKRDANSWFILNGIPVPGNNEYPLIMKPRFGSASKGIQIIRNVNEFNEFSNQYNLDEYLIQNFICAEEYTVDTYVDKKGTFLGCVPRKRLEILGGEVVSSITIHNEIMENLTMNIVNKAKFRGPITIQFLQCKKTSAIFVMEINPRLGGGVINSIEAGFNVPLFILNDYFNFENKPIYHWKENLLMLRVNREVFICK